MCPDYFMLFSTYNYKAKLDAIMTKNRSRFTFLFFVLISQWREFFREPFDRLVACKCDCYLANQYSKLAAF